MREASPLSLLEPRRLAAVFGLLFVLNYFDTAAVGGVKFALVWRAAFVAFALAVIASRPWRDDPVTRGLAPLFWAWSAYVAAPLVSLAFGGVTTALAFEATGHRLLPLLVVLLMISLRRVAEADLLLRGLAFFLCAVSVPLYLGVIAPIAQPFTLEHVIGLTARAYTSVFQNQHSAALAHAIAALVAWSIVVRVPRTQSWPYAAAFVGCVALNAATTARAGLAAVAIGLLVLAAATRSWRLLLVPLAAAILVALHAMVAWPQLYEFATERMLGRTMYQAGLSADAFTSGRLSLQQAALDAYSRQDFMLQAFGMGRDMAMAQIGLRAGSELMAHNAFVDELLNHGAAGLAALLAMLTIAGRTAYRNARAGFPLGLALFCAVAVFGALQSFDYSLHVSLAALAIWLESECRAQPREGVRAIAPAPARPVTALSSQMDNPWLQTR
ncbi:MAG TPA: O-antigen ligase family protein [Burkholderiaceae bacterium]|nr:O-antigen ligase family protein [Burkholderiaceae bacterium]